MVPGPGGGADEAGRGEARGQCAVVVEPGDGGLGERGAYTDGQIAGHAVTVADLRTPRPLAR